MKDFALSPSGVPFATFVRRMSPVEICGTPKRSSSTFAWVPLPAPGGPRNTRRIPLAALGLIV